LEGLVRNHQRDENRTRHLQPDSLGPSARSLVHRMRMRSRCGNAFGDKDKRRIGWLQTGIEGGMPTSFVFDLLDPAFLLLPIGQS
ncbi:hypothetical protein KCU89_g114, partial [Aureobasidium melanogenum]